MFRFLTIAAALVAATTATASASCGTPASAVAVVEKYGEQLVSTAKSKPGGVTGIVQTYANLETGTWTIIGTVPRRSASGVQIVSCVLDSGTGFTLMPLGEPT